MRHFGVDHVEFTDQGRVFLVLIEQPPANANLSTWLPEMLRIPIPVASNALQQWRMPALPPPVEVEQPGSPEVGPFVHRKS